MRLLALTTQTVIKKIVKAQADRSLQHGLNFQTVFGLQNNHGFQNKGFRFPLRRRFLFITLEIQNLSIIRIQSNS